MRPSHRVWVGVKFIASCESLSKHASITAVDYEKYVLCLAPSVLEPLAEYLCCDVGLFSEVKVYGSETKLRVSCFDSVPAKMEYKDSLTPDSLSLSLEDCFHGLERTRVRLKFGFIESGASNYTFLFNSHCDFGSIVGDISKRLLLETRRS